MDLNHTPLHSSRTGSIVNEMNLDNKREATIEDLGHGFREVIDRQSKIEEQS